MVSVSFKTVTVMDWDAVSEELSADASEAVLPVVSETVLSVVSEAVSDETSSVFKVRIRLASASNVSLLKVLPLRRFVMV